MVTLATKVSTAAIAMTTSSQSIPVHRKERNRSAWDPGRQQHEVYKDRCAKADLRGLLFAALFGSSMADNVAELEAALERRIKEIQGDWRMAIAGQVEKCLAAVDAARKSGNLDEALAQAMYASFYLEVLKRNPK